MKELDVVKNLIEADITHGCKSGSFESETLLPPGSKGTIVSVRENDAFLVEFGGSTVYDSCICYFKCLDLELVWEAPCG